MEITVQVTKREALCKPHNTRRVATNNTSKKKKKKRSVLNIRKPPTPTKLLRTPSFGSEDPMAEYSRREGTTSQGLNKAPLCERWENIKVLLFYSTEKKTMFYFPAARIFFSSKDLKDFATNLSAAPFPLSFHIIIFTLTLYLYLFFCCAT